VADDLVCADCGRQVIPEDEPFHERDNKTRCWGCAEEAAAKTEAECIKFARQHVKLTAQPHVYDPQRRFAPTPEEYDSGYIEAYTENSAEAHNRHGCTNYDELIARLDHVDPFDSVLYFAIRDRVHKMIEEAMRQDP